MAPAPESRRELAAFLQARRRASVPLGGGRRRTPGLRREEVAALANISVDYYTRLEQARAQSVPTAPVLDGLASAFTLTTPERAHIYRLTGRSAPESADDETSPALSFVLNAIDMVPAQILNDLGFVLAQNGRADDLFPWVPGAGLRSANVYEFWFLHDDVRVVFPESDRGPYSRAQAGELRSAVTRRLLSGDTSGQELVEHLLQHSSEFTTAWQAREVHDGRDKVIWLPSPTGPRPYRAHVTIDQGTGQRLLALQA